MYRRSTIVVLVNLAYFEVGLMVSIMGALIPDIIKAYHLSYSGAASLPVAYYIAFGVLAIPAGLVIEKFTYKKVLLFSYILAIAGIVLFAYGRTYYNSIIAIFIIGCALTVVQVLAFPLLRESVGAGKLPFHSTLNTFLYGLGSFASPYFYTLIISAAEKPSQRFPINILHYLSDHAYPWIAVYRVFLILFVVTACGIAMVKFPVVKLTDAERPGNLDSFRYLLKENGSISIFRPVLLCGL